MIHEYAVKANITILSHAADGDTKMLSAHWSTFMNRNVVQHPYHLALKARNHMLSGTKKLIFGKYEIAKSLLEGLYIGPQSELALGIQQSDISPIDKQNHQALMRLIDHRVLSELKNNEKTFGCGIYLDYVVRRPLQSWKDRLLSVENRITFQAVCCWLLFFIKTDLIKKKEQVDTYLKKFKDLDLRREMKGLEASWSLRVNFVTSNTVKGHYINLHTLLRLVRYFRQKKPTTPFDIHDLDEQPCEEIFRGTRTLSGSSASRSCNFTPQEFLERLISIEVATFACL